MVKHNQEQVKSTLLRINLHRKQYELESPLEHLELNNKHTF